MIKAMVLAASLLAMNVNAAPNSEAVKAALESLPTCSNFVRFDNDNLYLGFGPYKLKFEEPRSPIPATLQIVPIAHPEQAVTVKTTDAAIDSIHYGNSLFVLTYSGIEEWDLATKQRVAKYDAYMYPKTMEYMEHARAFAQYGHIAVIAHGRLGVSFFDMDTKRIVNQYRLLQSQLPLESTAMGVTVVGKFAYIVLDNFSLSSNGKKAAFRGIVKIDLDSQTVVSQLDGIDPGVDSVASDAQSLLVSFGGDPVWKYALGDLNGSALPKTQSQVWKFPVDGYPVGQAAIDDTYYYTCFSKDSATPKGPSTLVPMALSRAQLKL